MNREKISVLITSLTLVASLAACSSNPANNQQAAPNTSPVAPAASTAPVDGAMKGNAMQGDAMHNGNAMKGNAMQGDAMKDTKTKP